jgi:ribosomal protein L40E
MGTERETVKCAKCGRRNPKGTERCSECSHHLYVECPRCGHINERIASTCDKCGHSIRRGLFGRIKRWCFKRERKHFIILTIFTLLVVLGLALIAFAIAEWRFKPMW